jgi:methyltransferase family protein
MIARYRNLVESGSDNFKGLGITQYQNQIGRLIAKSGSKTVLDYGCGAGFQYAAPWEIHKQWGVDVPTLYDPAFASHDKLPKGKFDAVLCSDVLEHIPEAEVPALVKTLFDYSKRFVWASVCCRIAKKSFDDGLNMHVTVNAFWWWQAKFVKWSGGKSYVLVETR